MDNTLAIRFGIQAEDGLQTRSWRHCHDAGFRCVLCGDDDRMNFASTTLFDGQEALGDLCREFVTAEPATVAMRAHRRAEDLREQAEDLHDLAKDLSTLDPARWSTLDELRAEHELAMKEMRGGGTMMIGF